MTDHQPMTDKLHNALRGIGVSDPEIKLYTSAITLGPSSVTKLAAHLRMSRRNVYGLIAALQKRGLAKVTRGKKYFRAFVAESPIVILEKIRDKRDICMELDRDLLSAMPGLVALYNRGAGPARVSVVEGLQKLKILYEQILEEAPKEIQFYGSAKDFLQLFTKEEYDRRLATRLKKGVFVKALTPSQLAVERDDNEELREARVIDGPMSFLTTFQLVADKMIFWQPKTHYAVVIEDGCFVDMMRATFYALWAQATPCNDAPPSATVK